MIEKGSSQTAWGETLADRASEARKSEDRARGRAAAREQGPQFAVNPTDPHLTGLAWVVDGWIITGTVRDLAKTIEYAAHAGDEYPQTIYAPTVDGKLVEVHARSEQGPFTTDDYANGTVSVELNGQRISAGYRIDGRV